MYGRGRSRGGGRASEQQAASSTRSGAAKLKEEKKEEAKGKNAASTKKGKSAAASPAPPPNRASSRSPGRGGAGGQASGAQGSGAGPPLSRARSLPTPRGKPPPPTPRGARTSKGKTVESPAVSVEAPSGIGDNSVEAESVPDESADPKLGAEVVNKSSTNAEAAEEASKPANPLRERKRLKRPILNDNPDAPEVVDVPNMKSSHGVENEDASNTPQEGPVLLIVKPGKVREKRTLKGSQKMPSVAERESPLSVRVSSEDGVNSTSSAPHSPLKPVAQVSPFRSMPQSPCKGANSLSLNVKDIVGGLVDTAACLADGVEANGDCEGEAKDLSESDILTRMIRENLNKAVTAGTPDEMKKSLNDAIKNTFRNRSSNSNSSVASTPTEEKPVKTEKSDPNVLGEIVVNGNVLNGDKEKGVGAEKENKNELMESSDISDGLISHIVETLTDSGSEKAEQPKNPSLDADQPADDVIKDTNGSVGPKKSLNSTSKSAITVLPAMVSMPVPALMSSDGITDLPGEQNNPETAITLDQLEQGMVPVGSIQIEQIEADGTTTNVNSLADQQAENNINFSVVVMEEEEKPKLNIDKTKLFSQMNDIFAKDTHNALKHRPVYQKRTRQSPEDSKEPVSSPSKKKLKVKEGKVDKTSKAKTNLLAELENSEPKIEEDGVEDKPHADAVVEEKLVEVKELILQKDAEMKDSEEVTESMEEEEDSMTNNNVPDLSNAEDEASKDTEESPVEVPQTTGDDEDEDADGEAEEDVDEDEEEEDDDAEEEPEVDLDAPEDDKHTVAEVDLDEPKAEEGEKTCDITKTPDPEQSLKLPPVEALPTMQVSSSELTKSLRQVRLNKKTPVKSPLKEKWQPRNLTPDLDKEEEEIDDEEEEEEEIDDDEEEEVGPPDSPHLPNLSAGGTKGTEVFDFTDDEDIPLSNIDIAALNAGGPDPETPHATIPSSSPMPHLTPRQSPTKSVARRLVQDVSPQVLTAMDAIAAVQALQQSPPASRQDLPVVKLNGDVMSDDTDNSVGLKALLSAEKTKSTKRKKRRVPESDGAETDDDLDASKKGARPKRVKNLSGAKTPESSTPAASGSQTRPASAASVASTASASDKRDIEEVKQEEKLEAKHEDKPEESIDGKQTPDSQKSLSLDKESSKTLSTVVPEKASSFTIHPDRVCADMCFYCGLKFGMLDTPLHIAQLKTLEKQEFAMEYTGFVRDVCLCDRCFRFLDRRAAAKDMNGAKTLKEAAEPKEEKVKKCLVRTCNRQVTSKVSKRWLIRLKKRLVKKIGLDWDKVSKASVKAEFPFCAKHTNLIDFYSNCGLCRRKLTIQGICPLGMTTKEVEEMNILLREDHIPADLKENNFVCKLCKTFCGIKQKSLQPDYLKNHKTHKAFYKDYRRKLYIYLELGEDEKTEGKLTKKLFKVSQSDSGSCKITIRRDVTPEAGGDRKKKPREPRELLSPSDESRLQVVGEPKDKEAELVEKCSVNINFDLHTKKLWQDLHYPYGSYTSFFRHLILLERYWRAGDISLTEDASPKANAYIKSVQNRIKAYDQGRQTDLSASTRPDLEAPAAPTLSHTPGEAVLANLPSDGSRTPELRSPESTILRIPRVPQPRVSPGLTSPEPSTASHDPSTSPGPKIRVRQDLMAHLGLVAKNSANIVQQPPPKTSSSALTVTSTTCSTPNLSKLLSETGPPVVPSQAESRGVISIAPAKKSSNSQLFKSTESTGAIPLTFNNSIAEVLAAANKAKSARSREPSPKPEITITAKSNQGKSKSADQPQPQLLNLYSGKGSKLEIGPSKPSAIATSPSPSGGGLSILKRSLATSTSPSTTVNPLSNMHKLLQTQAPGLPPHIIAQQALPARPSPKVMGKPPGGPRPSTPTGASPGNNSANKPSGIQTVNKKSLNTVLDRLGGMGTTASPTMSKSPSLSSSLVQQLQAPPMTSRPGPKPGAKSQAKAQSQLQKALGGGGSAGVNSGMAQYANMFPGGLDPSALMSMIPSASNSLLSQSLMGFNQPNAAAAQAALMMAGMTGMSGPQAQQAMQELLQQQGQLMAAAQQQQQQQKQSSQQQMRAPPPLKHMSGGRGPNLGAKQD